MTPEPEVTRPRRVRTHALVAVAYMVLALLSHRTLVPRIHDHVYTQDVPGNDCLLHVWTLAWDHHALGTAPARLCDANIFHPHHGTLLYSDHLLGLALLLAPWRLVTDDVVALHNAVTIAAPVLNGLATYALALGLTGQPAAAAIGGLLYGFAPVRFDVDRCQVQMLAAWWLPIIIFAAYGALAWRDRRAAIVTGVALAFQGLTGIYLTAYLLPVLALLHVVWLRRFPLRTHARSWAWLLGCEIGAGLLLLPFSLAYRRVQMDLGAARPVVLNVLLSLDPRQLATFAPVVTVGVLAAVAILGRRHPPHFRRERPILVVTTLATLLLALGPSITLPFDLGQIRGPYALLLKLPGFNALRAPGRFVHLALLGMALLAAGGVAVLGRATSRPVARIATIAAALAVVVETWTPPMPLVAAPPPAATDPTVAWLAEQSDDVHLIDYPLDPFGSAATQAQYASIGHWRRIAVGNMGILPPLYPWLAHTMARFPEDDVLRALHTLGITHVVAHGSPDDRTRLAERAADADAGYTVAFTSPRALVLRLTPPGPPAPERPTGPRLDRTTWRVTASHGNAAAAFAIDDDLTTAWNSWSDLEAAVARWYDPVPFPQRWKAFLATQPPHLDVDLGAVATISRVVLLLGSSDPVAAPNVVLERSDDGRHWTPVAATPEPTPDALALVQHAADARFEIVPPLPITARHLRLRCNGVEWRIRDLAVHAG